MTYTPEDFPVGTIVEMKDGEQHTVTGTAPPTSEDEHHFFSVLLDGYAAILPNWRSHTHFSHIVSKPRVQDAPVASGVRVGDRVKITSLISGFTGNAYGKVYQTDDKAVYVELEPDGIARSFPRNINHYVMEPLPLTWDERLSKLSPRTVLEGKGVYAGAFAVKLSDKSWAISGNSLTFTRILEEDWTLPDGE
jgi:hypothetical protein